jgi:hypothetical protein
MKVETITEQLLFSTTRIETTTPLGTRTGTGFIFDYQAGDKIFPFIVTNNHVIENANYGRFFFTLGDDAKPFIGQRVDVVPTDFHKLWHRHSNPSIDIAITPFGPIFQDLCNAGKTPFVRRIPQSLIPGSASINDIDILE